MEPTLEIADFVNECVANFGNLDSEGAAGFRGTHRDEFRGVAPTGKRLTTTGISVLRVTDAKINDDWTSRDMLGLMQQLGAISP